jgi:hypothetical protein
MTSGKLHLFRKLEMAGKDTGSLRDAFTFGSVWHLVSLTSMILTVVRVGRLSHAIKYDVDTVARPCGNVVLSEEPKALISDRVSSSRS